MSLAHTLVQTETSHVLETSAGSVLSVTSLVLPDAGYVTSNVVDSIITLTQAAYDLLDPPDPRVLYVIVN